MPYLREKELHEGMPVKVNYKNLTGDTYTTEWRINPLLYEGLRYDASQLSQGSSAAVPGSSPPADAEGGGQNESSS